MNQKEIRRLDSRLAKYKALYNTPYRKLARRRLEVILQDNPHILELGIGAADIPKFIAERKLKVQYTGLDIRPYYISHAIYAYGSREDISYQLGDMRSLPFKDVSFDLVYTCATLHSIPLRRPRVMEKCVSEILRVAGKKVLIITGRKYVVTRAMSCCDASIWESDLTIYNRDPFHRIRSFPERGRPFALLELTRKIR